MYYAEDREPAEEQEEQQQEEPSDRPNSVQISLYYMNHAIDE